jgi:hypothetical protein
LARAAAPSVILSLPKNPCILVLNRNAVIPSPAQGDQGRLCAALRVTVKRSVIPHGGESAAFPLVPRADQPLLDPRDRNGLCARPGFASYDEQKGTRPESDAVEASTPLQTAEFIGEPVGNSGEPFFGRM